MTTYGELRGRAEVWPCQVSRAYMTDWEFQQGSFLADYAKAGKWAKVIEILHPDNHLVNVNQSWPGDSSRSTVLHRAAQSGAPADVIEVLMGRGALRSLRDADGRTPYELAVAAGEVSALELLRPPPSPFDAGELAILDARVAEVIDYYIQGLFGSNDLRKLLRYPPVEVLHEPPGRELWMQVPKMMGGFRVMLRKGQVELLGGYRRFDDAGEVHVTTHRWVVSR